MGHCSIANKLILRSQEVWFLWGSPWLAVISSSFLPRDEPVWTDRVSFAIRIPLHNLLKKQYTIFNMNSSDSNDSQVSRILSRISFKGSGWAFTPHDFADIGDPRSIGMALTRFVREGKIRRISRGLYDKPHDHPILGKVGAGTDSIVEAIARKKNLRILPSSAVAANQLGLTTQVPAKMVYHTDGAPAEIKLGKLHIEFRRNTGRMLGLAGRTSGLVAQALREFGMDGLEDVHIKRLQKNLSQAQKKQLLEDIEQVPAWMRNHFRDIASKPSDI